MKKEPAPRSRKAHIVRLVGVAAVFVASAAFLRESGLLELLADRDRLQARVEDLGWLAVFAYVAIWIPMQVLLSQAFLPTVAGGVMFGWLGGGILAVVGASLGCICQFLAARYVFRETAEWLVLSRFPGIKEQVEERGVAVLFLLRLFWTPSFALNVVAGITPISLRRFCVALPALAPAALLICFVTDSFYRFGWENMPTVRWLTMAGIVAGSGIAYVLARRRWPELRLRRKKPKSEP